MRDLKPFQKATVKVVQKALRRKSSTRRFLVADEVGLGKTLVAREIIRRMARTRSRKNPLVVLYVCSNLSIAAQNKTKLLEWLPKSERKDAASRVDRLTLQAERGAPEGKWVHLYTLTPDTSIPMRGNRSRGGRKDERAIIHALVKKLWPEFFRSLPSNFFRRNASPDAWRELVKKKNAFIKSRESSSLRRIFRDSVRKELELGEGMHIAAALGSMKETEEGEEKIIARFRNALAAGAISQLQPDLVIFDEFQRFRDLLDEDIDASAARVIGALRGEGSNKQPSLLLLSATPYRAYSRQWEEERVSPHREQFFELLEFLYRRTPKAKRIRKTCESALSLMEQELRKGALDSDRYKNARRTVEKCLHRVICRTERGSYSGGSAEVTTASIRSDLAPADLRVFKHMARSLSEHHRSAAPSYWSSIPLPMQTMGPGYKTWKAADGVRDRSVPSLRKGHRDRFRSFSMPAHPRLRALKNLLPMERLALPWISPSAPWWPLKGLWSSKSGDGGKVLAFSRFRAVPQAVAALMSFDLEAHLLSKDSIEYEEASKRKSLQPKASNVALLGHFYPSLFLIKNTDPIGDGIGSLRIARESVERQLRNALGNIGVRVRTGNHRRPTWSLIAALENMQVGSIEKFENILYGWSQMHGSGKARTRLSSGTGFRKMLGAWKKASNREISQISHVEFKDLARYAMSAPGVVVGRALARHWKGALKDENFIKCIEVSWKGLRNYLSSRLFMKALTRSERRYPEAIRKAALEGNLESVLDEHLWIASKLGGATGAELANELLEALRVRTSNFYIHPLGQKSRRRRFSLRCHAAMPFTDPRMATASLDNQEDNERPIRADELRKAFNTPFWPHLLVTTSVGQEGLDFHVWCENLLHWDLCSNPVDLEQREGRISRYGGLAIRRRLSQLLWTKGMLITAFTSPWAKLEKMAEKQYADVTGLAPWWVCQGAEVKRFIIDLPASEQKRRLEILRRERLLYRLALGQPNQEDLLEVLSTKFGADIQVEKIGLNLSALAIGSVASHLGK